MDQDSRVPHSFASLSCQTIMIYLRGLRWYRVPGQVIAPEETRVGVSSHKLCNRGTTAMFDIHIINLDSGSYLRMILQKVLAKAEKDNK